MADNEAEEVEVFDEEEVLDEEEVEEGDEEVEAEQHEAAKETLNAGDLGSSGDEINVNALNEIALQRIVVSEAQNAWKLFINSQSSLNAAGEVIYNALFESAPSLQSLFVTPRAVQAMRFMNGLHAFVNALDDPPALRTLVENLGFGHLVLAVTVPRVIIFRDAILDLLQVELGSKLSKQGNQGLKAMLNYVGGGIIFIKANYAERLRILAESWKLCNDDKDKRKEEEDTTATGEGAAAGGEKKKHGGEATEATTESKSAESLAQNVPTTYREMFQFNAAVMGFGNSIWMNEVLACFDTIVTNVSNSYRFLEECDILVLRISKLGVKPNLGEYKSCMLATLRSLLPKDWSTLHEVAWSWLWENIENNLVKTLGLPPKWAKSVTEFVHSLDETTAYEFRAAIYVKFFEVAPASQDYFKQSNTYLHIIAQKIIMANLDMYAEPVRMVDDISALGLRHVGYAIPTELFSPLVTAIVEVLKTCTEDQSILDGFQWAMSLVAKMLVRTTLEGSTVVMKAINTNSKKVMQKAVMVAPRGERAAWVLIVQVGTQKISPLAWSIEAGSLDSCSAMINDLLTIRADRDNYYYGMDALFQRHPDIVKMLIEGAPGLLAELFEKLIWRSRLTFNGLRRINYYLKYLLVDLHGKFAPTLDWLARFNDPVIVCHPILTFLADTLWGRVAMRAFFLRKSWFLFSLVVFVVCQSILERGLTDVDYNKAAHDISIGLFRIFIYLCSMGQLIFSHAGKMWRNLAKRDVFYFLGNIPLPKYWQNWQEVANFLLMTFLMLLLCTEPILRCLEEWDTLGTLTEACKDAEDLKFSYSVFAMCSMFLYFMLLIDLAVLNNRVSAFVLVCQSMLSEVGLFLVALVGIILAFASALSCLEQDVKKFRVLWEAVEILFEIVVNMASGTEWEAWREEWIVLAGAWIFLLTTVLFLIGVLIAQLSCAYDASYQDMVGFARLKRIKIIIEVLPQVGEKGFRRFMHSLRLDENLEYNEGDVGVSGGIQIKEAATLHPTTVDMIKRFGGTTSTSTAWPEDDSAIDDDTDRFERLEKAISRAMTRLAKGGSGHRAKGGVGSSMSGSGKQEESGSNESGGSAADGEEDFAAEGHA